MMYDICIYLYLQYIKFMLCKKCVHLLDLASRCSSYRVPAHLLCVWERESARERESKRERERERARARECVRGINMPSGPPYMCVCVLVCHTHTHTHTHTHIGNPRPRGVTCVSRYIEMRQSLIYKKNVGGTRGLEGTYGPTGAISRYIEIYIEIRADRYIWNLPPSTCATSVNVCDFFLQKSHLLSTHTQLRGFIKLSLSLSLLPHTLFL
jgi:hypothetical protein